MTRANTPAARMGHSAVVYDKKLWIFGGKGEKGGNFNDLKVYSFTKDTWLSPQTIGSTPGQRRSHSAVVYKNKMYIFLGDVGHKIATDMFEYDFGKATLLII
jgi:N-acetylneuraminic acid mutarotase